MDTGGLDPAALGGLAATGAVVLGGLIWWCRRRYEIHIVKQRRARRWKAQQKLILPTLEPRLLVRRSQMKTLIKAIRPGYPTTD